MKKNLQLLIILILGTLKLEAQDPQLSMQAWYWDYPKTANGHQWTDTLNNKAGELAEAGFTHLWIPPHAVASSGQFSNGYDPKDLFIGNQTTGFGTRNSLDLMLSEFATQGISPVADLIYNHRDGGAWEDNPAVREYIFDNDKGTTDGGSPFPNDRYRFVLPIGGSTGINAGDLYFKLSSKSGGFGNKGYKVYMYTDRNNTYNPSSINEAEPNGGGDCGQAFDNTNLATDFFGLIDDSGCTVDELKLTLTSDDFFATGDTLYIEIRNTFDGYHDLRPYGIWSTSANADVLNQLKAQTLTDFSNMPSGRGEMHWDSFRPNFSNVGDETLSGNWNEMLFFYDYDQFQSSTIDTLNTWTEWNYDELGVRGIRMDAIKHFTPTYVSSMINHMVDAGKAPNYVVGEWFDTDRTAQINWVNDVNSGLSSTAQNEVKPKVFDFSLRESLRNACDGFNSDDNNNSYDVRNVFNNSLNYAGLNGVHVSTFVNNHDFRKLGSGYESLVLEDPKLAYAYILTNNQIGVPTVFYPDYYGYPTGPAFSWHPTGQDPLEREINDLWAVHKKYINGADNIHYLNSFDAGNTFDDNANYISGASKNSLIYQVGNTALGKSIIVAINFSEEALKVDHQINTFFGAIGQGSKFTDVLQNSNFSQAVVDNQDRIYMDLPPRSYSVWVQGDVCPIKNVIPENDEVYTASFECEEDGWTNYYRGNAANGDLSLLLSIEKDGESIGTIGDGTFEVKLSSDPTSTAISTEYNDNATNYSAMNRYWDVTPTNQPTKPLNIRYYYSDADFDALNSASGGLINNHEDLTIWKINGTYNQDPVDGHTAIPEAATFDADGYWAYTNGIASTSEYTYGRFPGTINGPYHFVEYFVNSFSGGGVAFAALPDLVNVITFNPSSFTETGNQEVTISIFEANNVPTTGEIELRVTKTGNWFNYSFDPNQIVNEEGRALDNDEFTVDFSGSNIIIKTNATIEANGFKRISFNVETFVLASFGETTITSRIIPESGGEDRDDNNIDAETFNILRD